MPREDKPEIGKVNRVQDELLTAVRSLTTVVSRLEKTLVEDYPKRAELDRKFESREEVSGRRRRWALTMFVGVIGATFIGFGVTISTVSTCFLTADARDGRAPKACNALPGFKDASAEQKRLRTAFEDLLEQPAINDKRIDRIEKLLGIR